MNDACQIFMMNILKGTWQASLVLDFHHGESKTWTWVRAPWSMG